MHSWCGSLSPRAEILDRTWIFPEAQPSPLGGRNPSLGAKTCENYNKTNASIKKLTADGTTKKNTGSVRAAVDHSDPPGRAESPALSQSGRATLSRTRAVIY